MDLLFFPLLRWNVFPLFCRENIVAFLSISPKTFFLVIIFFSDDPRKTLFLKYSFDAALLGGASLTSWPRLLAKKTACNIVGMRS